MTVLPCRQPLGSKEPGSPARTFSASDTKPRNDATPSVPRAASAPLLGMVGSADKEEVVLKGGHVSLVAGGNAVRRLWPKLAQWLGERST